MRHRLALLCALILAIAVAIPASAGRDQVAHRSTRERTLPEGFRPAVLSQRETRRYFVALAAPGALAATARSRTDERAAVASALAAQSDALRQVRSLGGTVIFRYSQLVNGFSAEMTAEAAAALASRPDVRFVEVVPAVQRTLESSVPSIGAPKVWNKLDAKGQGVTVAVVDTGVDYTHADFNGPGTVEAYESNDPTIIEPGTFPTNKVIGGYDFVGDDYSVVDDDPEQRRAEPRSRPARRRHGRRSRDPRRRHLLRRRRRRRDRQGRCAEGEDRRREGLGRRELLRRRARRGLRVRDGPEPGRQHRRRRRHRPVLRRRGLRPAELARGRGGAGRRRRRHRVRRIGRQLGQPGRGRPRLHPRDAGLGAGRDRGRVLDR